MALGEIEEFLLLDVDDTLGNMERAESRPEFFPCETVIGGLRSLPIPPPSPRGIMELVSGE
jgi:hypothetical protein